MSLSERIRTMAANGGGSEKTVTSSPAPSKTNVPVKPLTHIDEVIEATGGGQPQQDKHEMFKEWADKHGAIWPKVKYPYFSPEDGTPGLQLLDDVHFREAFVMVPCKLILCCSDLLKHEVLGPIYQRYRDCFDENRQKDWEYNVLIVALLYQMTLGTESFWYPYLRILPKNANTLLPCLWSEELRKELQDERFEAVLEEMKIDLILTRKRIQKVLEDNVGVFPKLYHNRELFLSLYSLVTSRCFPRGIIPIADLINHSNDVSSYEFVNTDLHAKGHLHPSYFLISRYLASYSQLDPLLPHRYSPTETFHHTDILSAESIRSQLLLPEDPNGPK